MSKVTAFFLGITAYVIWGLSPIYFKSIQALPATEIILHRIIWSAICCLLVLFFITQKSQWLLLLKHPKYIVILMCTGLILSGNWLLYVWAINNGYMFETSLGYYINPLISVFLGMVVLKEKLQKLQWLAIILAATGVLIQIILLGSLPWISLLLGLSFAFYGLIRKIVPVQVFTGMFIETWILVPVALFWLWYHPTAETLQPYFWGDHLWLLCMLAGPLTLVPLILFNLAAKNLPYSTIGFLQYTSPTLVFLLATFYFKEHLNLYTLITFAFIWAALIIFSINSYMMVRKNRH
ncbi:EamA family transporter RarD [Utexia brackfieldae]|uniref:EamA family transporter RarD n=1 Tax=Utexia brackfieldae TaxID=3074108 RepID=UPI00370D2801